MNAAGLGLTVDRWVGFRLTVEKLFQDLKRVNRDVTMLGAAIKHLERMKAEGETLNEETT